MNWLNRQCPLKPLVICLCIKRICIWNIILIPIIVLTYYNVIVSFQEAKEEGESFS